MSTYIVTYDLRKPGRNYEDLYTYLKSLDNWCHLADSTWVVVSSKSAEQIRDGIAAVVDAGDRYAVIKGATPGVGAWHGMADEVSDWLKKYL